jgi:hypothetical protein
MEDFARTRRGSKFFELDIPKIAEQLERIAAQMERKNRIEEKRFLLEQRKYNKENKIIDETDINDFDKDDFINK